MPTIDQLTLLDYGVLGVVALSALLSVVRGGVRESLGLASWIGAAIVAFFLFDRFQPIALDMIGNELIANIATAIGLFIIPLIIFQIISGFISDAIAASPLGVIDRMLGLAFGVLRGLLIACIAFLFAGQILPEDKLPPWFADAWVRPHLEEGAQWLRQFIPDGFLDEADKAVEETTGPLQQLQELQESATGLGDALTDPAPSEGTSGN